MGKEKEFMLRSMYSGIGGMRNFQTKLDVIGNNIANVNTYGYKKGRTTFKDLVSQQLVGASGPTNNRGGTNPQQVGLGSSLASIDTIQTQGSIQTTNRDLDIGISGDGFFIVNDGDLSYYTRAGNFYLDDYGNLVNADGLFVQGYPAVDGVIDYTLGIGNLQIAAGQLMSPEATTYAQFRGNLNADFKAVTEDVNDISKLLDLASGELSEKELLRELDGYGAIVPFPAVDSLGREVIIHVTFQKRDDNKWEVGYLDYEEVDGEINYTRYNSLADNLTFTTKGVVDLDFLRNVTIENYDSSTDAEPLTIEIDLSLISQFSRSSTVDYYSVDGNFDGTLNSYSISASGEIYGVFSNGQAQLLGQIALANFNNPSGLTKAGNNLYAVSNNSGDPTVGIAGDEGLGTLRGAALEMSNVDLSEEFAEMIVAQRGFQANTRMITTSDEILQELVNLKR